MSSRSIRCTVPGMNAPSSITGMVLAPEAMVEVSLWNTKGKGENTERRIGITMAHIEKLRIRRRWNGFRKRYHRAQQMVGFTGRWHWEDQLDNAKHDPEGLTSSCAGPFQRPLRPVSKHYACLSMYAGVDLFQGRNISQHAETLHPSNPTKCWAGAAWEKLDRALVEDAAHTLWSCRYPSLLEPIAFRQLAHLRRNKRGRRMVSTPTVHQ